MLLRIKKLNIIKTTRKSLYPAYYFYLYLINKRSKDTVLYYEFEHFVNEKYNHFVYADDLLESIKSEIVWPIGTIEEI